MQCPAYVSSSEQGDWRVEEGEYELVKGIVFLLFFFVFFKSISYLSDTCLFVCLLVCLFVWLVGVFLAQK